MNVDDTTVCPACESAENVALMLMGTTGNTNLFRCRYCGWIYGEEKESE